MARGRTAAHPVVLLLAAAVLLAGTSSAVAWDDELPTNMLASGAGIASNDAESELAQQMLRGMLEVAQEIVTGEQRPPPVSAFSVPSNLSGVNASSVQAKIMATAVINWQLGVWNSPYNKGLTPQKFNFYERDHYYQVPKDPVGTLVLFHGCNHDASGSWPYDPVKCPNCLGLPEEVAHVKQALAHGFAVLAVESRNRSRNGRCFSSSADETSDQYQAPYVIQSFLYMTGLQELPVYTLGISAGATFAAKVVKNFFDPQFGGVIKAKGIISEVDAPNSWRSWGLMSKNGSLKYPDFPPVAFIAMERDNRTNQRIFARVKDLKAHHIPADWVMVRPRKVDRLWFYNRSPVITAKQSAVIVQAMQQLGFLDKEGNIQYDPRVGVLTGNNPLANWNQRLVQKLPWLSANPKGPPTLSVLSDRSTIFEEMNVAWSYHEGIADYLTACLVWLQSGGTLNLKELGRQLGVHDLRSLTMKRVYPRPPPPLAKKSPPPPARPQPRPKPRSHPRPRPRPQPKPMKTGRRALQ